ncbi:MAG TPA: hypothetical protein VGX69_00670 [Solirubrobacteraceae bacterium]|jgi:hypothetical protein|nr:hypothetical protein [Solirubrobacteraceae bacterium]
MRVKALTALLALIICGWAPGAASALGEQASLRASFTPDRLGVPTTIQFGFQLSTSEGAAPPPLSALDLHMPAGMNYTTTTLGLSTCQPAALLAEGLAGCSPNSRLGYGSALVEVPFGVGSGHELPEIQALSGPSPKGNLTVLFYANGSFPVSAQLVFSGEVLPDSGRFGSQLVATVPPVSSVPGGPDVSILGVNATIGPSRLVYYKRVRGRRVAFRPRGVAVPERCPRGGFPFSAEFTFQDQSRASAQTTVPCPPARRR